jgi:SAM-dependent methyltransferase
LSRRDTDEQEARYAQQIEGFRTMRSALAVRDTAARYVYKWRASTLKRPASELGDPELRKRIDAFGPWFQNIDINGTPTKISSQMGEPLDNPARYWRNVLLPAMPEVRGKSVLDIGCNCGFHSIECKKMGAARVVGIDVNQGRPEDFVAMARFAAGELDLDIEFRNQDFFTVEDGPFDVVMFLGVLYHLDDPIAGLRKVAELVGETLVISTRTTPRRGSILAFKPGGWEGDPTTPWLPSAEAVTDLLRQNGFRHITPLNTNTRRAYAAVARR